MIIKFPGNVGILVGSGLRTAIVTYCNICCCGFGNGTNRLYSFRFGCLFDTRKWMGIFSALVKINIKHSLQSWLCCCLLFCAADTHSLPIIFLVCAKIDNTHILQGTRYNALDPCNTMRIRD